MTPVPQYWTRTTLGSVARSVRNGIFARRPNDVGDGARILRISAVRRSVVDVADSRFVADITDQQLSKFSLAPGDLLVTRYNGSRRLVGISGLVPTHEGLLLHPDKLIRVQVNHHITDPRFLNYQLESQRVRAFLEPRIRTTAGQSGIAGKDVREIPVVLPPLMEQRRIVDILEDHLSRLHAAEDYATTATKRLEGIAESALRALLADVRAKRALGELLDVPLGNGKSVPTRADGFPVLRLTALKDDGVDLRERKGGDWTRGGAQRYLVARDDFLLARGNGSLRLVGRGSLVRGRPDAVAYPDTMIRVRVKARDMFAEFLDVVWNSAATRSQIEAEARTTAGIYKVNQKQVAAIRLPVPSLAEQFRITTRMAEVDEQARRTRDAVERAQRRGTALRAALLTAAFSGKLTGRHTDQELIETVVANESAVVGAG